MTNSNKIKTSEVKGHDSDVSMDIILSHDNMEKAYEGYIQTYYGDGVQPDEAHVLKWNVDWVANHAHAFSAAPTVLEIGGGETIHHLLPFISLAEDFVVADLRASATEAIRRWRNGNDDGKIWRPFVEFTLREERRISTVSTIDIDARLNQLKEKLREMCYADLSQTHPLVNARSFPLVLCYYTTEVAALNSISRWKDIMRNLCNLVSPGGHLLMACVRDSEFYAVIQKGKMHKHYIPRLREEHFIEAFQENGFNMSATEVRPVSLEGQEEHGVTSILLIAAQKLS
jgi:hypothetical protein